MTIYPNQYYGPQKVLTKKTTVEEFKDGKVVKRTITEETTTYPGGSWTGPWWGGVIGTTTINSPTTTTSTWTETYE